MLTFMIETLGFRLPREGGKDSPTLCLLPNAHVKTQSSVPSKKFVYDLPFCLLSTATMIVASNSFQGLDVQISKYIIPFGNSE